MNVAKRVSSYSLLTVAMLLGTAPLFAANAGISFGPAQRSGGKVVVPVLLDTAAATGIAAFSIRVRTNEASGVTIRAAQGLSPAFQASPRSGDSVSYVAWFNEAFKSGSPVAIAEIEVSAGTLRRGDLRLDIDPDLAMLSDAAGIVVRSVANGQLSIPRTLLIPREGRERQNRQ